MSKKRDNPNVVAPPPLIFLSGLLVGGLLSRLSPAVLLPTTLAVVAGFLFAPAGFGLIAASVAQMRRARTKVAPWQPTTAIVAGGVYGFSRNPIYLGMILIYLGASFLFNSFWFLPPLAPVFWLMHFGVIVREEQYLERKFGDDYLNYKNRVRRWI